MIGAASPDAAPGSLVRVYDKHGQPFGSGLYNPRARVPLRMVHHGAEPVTEEHFSTLLARALDLRLELLRLPEQTDAFRVVHSDGDGLGGLVVDKFSDTLSVQVHSLGIYQRLDPLLEQLHAALQTQHHRVHVEPHIARIEGIRPPPPPPPLRPVRIREHGLRFEVDIETGHKTGFFCDQRENRRRLAAFARDKRVLDLCCYTGGFALAAAKAQWVHCDAFSYARQMRQNQTRWDVVVLDPPKLIESRETEEEDLKKLEDLNILALQLVEPGGWFVTCSCAGLLSTDAFEELVIRAAHRIERRLQFINRTGAGPDHPVMSNCLEGRYLNVLWARA
jgi:23S rRNA (cytosine1962-C5)-methyltransferase